MVAGRRGFRQAVALFPPFSFCSLSMTWASIRVMAPAIRSHRAHGYSATQKYFPSFIPAWL
jgi:hypothetical protein